ncbi:MAG: AMP-binding protein [Roseovarius sp.]
MPQNRIDRIFQAAADDSRDVPFLLFQDGSSASYGDVFDRASRLASVISQAGIAPGERVLSLVENSREAIEFFVGCSIAGTVGVAVNFHSTASELAALMDDCKPSGIVTQGKYLERLAEVPAVADLKLRLLSEAEAPNWQDYHEAVGAAEPLAVNQDFAEHDPAMMVYSSGTTGRPKGILLSHHGIVQNGKAMTKALGYRPGDRSMTLLPLFSSFGFAFDFIHMALMRNSTVILKKFEEAPAIEGIERFGVTFLAGVPTMFARLFTDEVVAGRDISSLRLIDVGGGPVSVRLKQMLSQEFGINVVESYGLTEISPVASVQRTTENLASDSCGQPLPRFEVRTVGPDGKDTPINEPGELCFRSDTFMLGYWGQPELTAKTIVDGWLHTGDVGVIDELGAIRILDRTKDMIVANGFNVFPKEIENVIHEIEGIRECAVVGVPDDVRGEVINAFIVPKTDVTPDLEAIITYCRKKLSRYKVPRTIHVLDEMPLTASGKIRRHVLREAFPNTAKE